MRSNNSSVYPAEDVEDFKNNRRSSLAIDVSKRIRLFTSTNALDTDYGTSDRGRTRRTTVAYVPHSSAYRGNLPAEQHRSVTELRDFQFYQESPFRKNNGRPRTGSSEEIFLEDVQDEVSCILSAP